MKLNLRDTDIIINGYVSDCRCKCKHCLLCSGDNKISKVNYDKLEQLALKFDGFLNKTGIDVIFAVYNSAEYPQLQREMDVNKRLSKTSGGYLNLNGTKIRHGKELIHWVNYLKSIGVTHANLSWFGYKDVHDTFVNREGYFDYLLELANELKAQNVQYHNSVFILKRNIKDLKKLYEILSPLGGSIHYAMLDYRGNAKNIRDEFITEDDIIKLPQFIFEKQLYNSNRFKSEREWISLINKNDIPTLTRRSMFLVATPQNIDTYLKMTPNEIIKIFHDKDRRLQESIPSIQFLTNEYGDVNNKILYDYRSLLWKWIDKHFETNDILDKSLVFSDLHTSVMWR